jgi:ABC-type transport system involved in multi-copper enzyme maturation permease subunit
MNPIISRELRSRFRGRRAFLLLLLYSAALAVAMALLCREIVPAPSALSAKNVSFKTVAQAGHELFTVLVCIQISAWMLLAPGLTATGLAGEREHGLLESLQLSPLRPFQIAAGKLASALLFALLLTIVALPASAICFLLGGVSSGEFLLTLLLQLVTSTTCATIGLYFSAWSRRAAAALRNTFAVIIVWGIGSAIAYAFSRFPLGGSSGTFVSRTFYQLLNIFGSTNPIFASLSITDSRTFSIGAPPIPPTDAFAPITAAIGSFAGLPPYVISCVLQAILAILLFRSATRALRRPLPEQHWIEPRTRQSRTRKSRATGHTSAASSTRSEPKQSRNARGWWEIPLTSWLRFSNPVLEREVRGKFRMRSVSPVVIAIEAVLAAGVFYFYLRAIWWAITEPDSRSVIWWVLAFTALIVVMIAVPVMGSGGADARTRRRHF